MSALAVIDADAAAANTARRADPYASPATIKACALESAEARAAVAELIEAAQAFERATGTFKAGPHRAEARKRLRVAIARVKGVQP